MQLWAPLSERMLSSQGQFHVPPPTQEEMQRARRMQSTYADRIPVYVRIDRRVPIRPKAKHKFLVPRVLRDGDRDEPFTCAHMLSTVRRQCKTRLAPEHALFVFLPDGTLLSPGTVMSELFARTPGPILVIQLMRENTFGC